MHSNFYRTLLAIFCCLTVVTSKAQVDIVNNDTTICEGGTVMLHANTNGRIPIPIPLNQDDVHADIIVPIGFPFTFYGVTHTQCVVSANGFITFDLSKVGTYSSYVLNGPEDFFPGNIDARDAILAAFSDIDPSVAGGSIDYALVGVAPNRRFIVSFCNSGLYSCNDLKASFQIVLHETSNLIDIHLISQPAGLCTQWNSGHAAQGVHNANGTLATMVPGRNWDGVWTAYNESRRFTPNGPADYTQALIPHAPVPDSLATITWYSGGVVVGTGHDFLFNYTTTQTLTAMVTQCQDTITDDVTVTVQPLPEIHTVTPTDVSGCGLFDGTFCLQGGLIPNDTFYVHYSKDGTPEVIVMGIADVDSIVCVTGLGAGVYSNIYVTTPLPLGCMSNIVGPVEIEDPTPVISGHTVTIPSLCRASDASMTLQGLIPGETYTITYNATNGSNGTIVLVADAGGEVTITGLLAGAYTVTATLLTCTSDPYGPITIVNPAVTADFSHLLIPGCTEDIVEFTNLSTGSAYPFEYVWLFGDDSSSVAQDPIHTYQDQGTYTVTLMITDSVCRDTVTHDVIIDHPLVASFTVDQDTICQGTTIAFTDGSTATPPVSYAWDFANGEVNTTGGASVTSIYPYAGNYIATLVISDFIGCKDTAYKYIRVDSLTEINLSFLDSAICAGEKAYINATYADSGSTGIMWDFGDGITSTTFGHDNSHSYETPGVYTIKVIATARVCADVEKTIDLLVQPQPVITLGPDTAMCPTSAPIVIQDLINGGNPSARWTWVKGDATIPGANSFNLVVKEPAIYTSVVTIGDCSSADSIWVQNDCYLDVPNAFTPDGDGQSDYFFPRQWLSRGVTNFKMLVFNRWGNEIFSSTNINGRGWDGKFNDVDQPQGVYVYYIEVTFKNGVSEKRQGNVTLLR